MLTKRHFLVTFLFLMTFLFSSFSYAFDHSEEFKSLSEEKDVVEISSGKYHTCTLLKDGSVKCQGENLFHQATVPKDLGPAVQIVSGDYHTCALLLDGSVKCWGWKTSDPKEMESTGPEFSKAQSSLDTGARFAWMFGDSVLTPIATFVGGTMSLMIGGLLLDQHYFFAGSFMFAAPLLIIGLHPFFLEEKDIIEEVNFNCALDKKKSPSEKRSIGRNFCDEKNEKRFSQYLELKRLEGKVSLIISSFIFSVMYVGSIIKNHHLYFGPVEPVAGPGPVVPVQIYENSDICIVCRIIFVNDANLVDDEHALRDEPLLCGHRNLCTDDRKQYLENFNSCSECNKPVR